MSRGYRYLLPGASEDLDSITEIPGVRVFDTRHGHMIIAPENAAWLVEAELRARGIPIDLIAPARPPPLTARAALPYLKEWVPAFLTSYQRDGVAKILAQPDSSGMLVWSAGSGKTLAAIVWALSRPGLCIVATRAAARGTWQREIETYTQGVGLEVVIGRGNGVATGLPTLGPSTPHFLVVSYEILASWIGTIESWAKGLSSAIPVSVVFDESHRAKNHSRWTATVKDAPGESGAEPAVAFSPKENVTAAAMRLSKLGSRRLATTATPIPNRVRDLWAQLDLVHPWDWDKFRDFARRYCGATENTFGGLDTGGASNLDELKRRLAFVVHRVPFSVANRDLPPKRRLVTYVRVSEQVRPEPIAAEMRSAMREATSTEGRTRLLELRLMEAASRKRKIVIAHVQDAIAGGLKVVIFTGRRSDARRLAAEITKGIAPTPNGSFPVWLGTGEDSPEARDAIREAYMKAPGPAVLVGTGDAFGESVDLQDTDLAIMAMLPYTPGQIVQWEGRFSRLGQKRPVLVRYLIAEGTVDEHVAAILLRKLPGIERTVDSDEVRGLGRELIGISEEDLVASLLEKVIGAPAAGEIP